MDELTIEIPLPMPTWNRLLGMHERTRMVCREYLHHAVLLSLTYGNSWPTTMEFRGRRYSTELFELEYLQMIRPSSSRKSRIAKLRGELKKRS